MNTIDVENDLSPDGSKKEKSEKSKKSTRKTYPSPDDLQNATEIVAMLPNDFGAAMKMLMKIYGITIHELCERTMMDESMIKRMRNSKGKRERLSPVTTVCIGLHILPCLSLHMVELAGIHIMPDIKESLCLQVLMTRYNCTIHECNEYTASLGFGPLIKEK